MLKKNSFREELSLKRLRVLAFCFILPFLVLFLAADSAASLELTIFGPKRYDRLKGKPTVYHDAFKRCSPSSTTAALKIRNGDAKATRLKAATVSVNGAEIVSENEFKPQVPTIEKTISVQETNTLDVVLKSGMQDDPNNTNSKDQSFLVIELVGKDCDSAPPVISSPEPRDGAILNSAAPRISASYADETNGSGIDTSSVRLLVDGNNVTSSSSVSSTGVSYTPSSPLAEGTHTATVAVSDLAHNPASLTWRFTTDSVPPLATITAPAGNSLTNTKTIAVTGTLSEPVASVTINGAPAVVSGLAFNLGLGLSEGPNTIIVQAVDLAGNAGTASIKVTLDTRPPVTTATPAGGIYGPGLTVTLATSETATVYYTTDGTAPTLASAVYSGPIAVTASAMLRYFAVDLAGNTEGVKTAVYGVDVTPPSGSIAINNGAAYTNNPAVTLTLTCTDALSGCARMSFSADNTNWSAPEPYAATKAWTLASGDGQKIVYAKFLDGIGNVSGATSAAILLDTAAPAVSVAFPTPGVTTNSTPLLLYTVSDGTVVVKVDGATVAVTSGSTLGPLANGQHTLLVQSTDAAGNRGSGTVTFTANSNHATSVSGRISTDTTWTLAGSPYIVTGSVQVYGTTSTSATLTIQPGVIVKFNAGTSLTIGNGGSLGALYAVGTASAPILFTSSKSTPAPGDWGGIIFSNGTVSANTVLDHATVEYGGSGGTGNIYITSASPTIKDSTIGKSSNYGINIFAPSTAVIRNNNIMNNGGYGIYDYMGSGAAVSGNTFSGNGSYPARLGINQVGGVNTYGTNGINAVEVPGNAVRQDLTMRNIGIPYSIITNPDINAAFPYGIRVYGTTTTAATLTVEPGVVVKFTNGAGLSLQTGLNGSKGALNAVGTASAPILFTSARPAPVAGDWGGIIFYNGTVSANSVLDYVTVEYGGASGANSGNVSIYSGSPVIKDSVIRKSSNSGIYVYYAGSPVLQNNVISDNGTHGLYGSSSAFTATGNIITNSGQYGIYDNTGSAVMISGNTISGSGSYPLRMRINQVWSVNTFGANGINAIEVLAGTVTQNLTMKNSGLPYVITSDPDGPNGNTIWDVTVSGAIANPPLLAIEAGVTVKFNNDTGLSIGPYTSTPGVLKSAGTASTPVLFTTNDSAPAPGKWKGITLGPGSANSTLDYTTVEYGGSGGLATNADLICTSSSPIIRNCTIRNSAGSGVYLSGATNSPVIVDSTITGNKWGVYASSSNPFITNTTITGNTTAGVWNSTTSPDVDARNNWWGAATGPTYSGNAQGTGDKISDHVLYNPWLSQAAGPAFSIRETRVMPTSVNPSGGGYVTFTAQMSSSATWTITITDANSTVVNAFTGMGTAIKQKWYGNNAQGATVADGAYYYRIDAMDQASGSSASSPEGMIMVSSVIPVVYMDPPVDQQMFAGGTTIAITGTAKDPADFKNYMLDYGVGGDPAFWTTLKTSTTPVTDGLIYSWNTASLANGLYTLRLTATDNAGNVVVDTARVRLLWIQNMASSQSYISPNGDGIQDSTTLSATFTYDSAWTITFNNASGSAVRILSGTGTSLSQTWDGKNDAGALVPDGVYTYVINATSAETGIQAAATTGTITVDATSPTASITAPSANSVLWDTVTITGSAFDTNINTYKVEYGPAAGTGPWTVINTGTSSINNGTLATWVTNDPSKPAIPNGSYLIRLTVADKAGNSSIASVPVILDDLRLSNVAASANTINTYNSESSTIFFTINEPATVTFKIIPEKQGMTGTPIYQTSQNCSAAGAYLFTWDGKDNTGKVAPDEVYLYILEANDGARTFSYSPPAPTGAGSVTCTHENSFSPYKNDPMTITYTPSQPERVTISINWGGRNFNILDGAPFEPRTYTFDWDGRNPQGKALDGGAAVSCAAPALLGENHIITTGDTPKVSGLKTDPYSMSLSYGQFTRVSYTLSRDSLVTVNILTSAGAAVATPVGNALQTGGTHELEWRGLNPNDATEKGTVLTGEGDYIVTVQATNPVTGTSSTTRGQVNIHY